MILHLRKIKHPNDFIDFWNHFEKIQDLMSNEDKDETFINSLIGKRDKNPSLLRRIAKAPTREGNSFLDHLLTIKKTGQNPYVKTTSLLADPDLYSKKKEGHRMRDLAEREAGRRPGHVLFPPMFPEEDVPF